MKTYKGVLIDTDGKLFPCKLKADEFIEEARHLIEGWVELVHCNIDDMERVILVDEEGLLKKLPINQKVSILAGRKIVGPAIILDELPRDEI